jgi:hypothetical protein
MATNAKGDWIVARHFITLHKLVFKQNECLEQRAVAVLLADDGHRAAKPELLPAAYHKKKISAFRGSEKQDHLVSEVRQDVHWSPAGCNDGVVGTNLSSRYQAASAHGSFRTSSTLPVLQEHRMRRHGTAWMPEWYYLTAASNYAHLAKSMHRVQTHRWSVTQVRALSP